MLTDADKETLGARLDRIPTEREPMGNEERPPKAHNYVVFRCDVDDSTIVSVEAPERGKDVYLGVAECPDMRTAQVVMESLRARESGPGKCEPSTEPEQPASEGAEITRWVEEALADSGVKCGWFVPLRGALSTRGINVNDPGTYTLVLYRGNPGIS